MHRPDVHVFRYAGLEFVGPAERALAVGLKKDVLPRVNIFGRPLRITLLRLEKNKTNVRKPCITMTEIAA